MRLQSASLYLGLSAFAFGAFGCGIVSKDLDAEVTFDFTIDGDENEPHFLSVETFDPNNYPDVKDNRDKVEAGTVAEIILELTSVLPGNQAYFVAGQVDVKRAADGDDKYISAVGQWSGIPLYSDENGTTPALGQAFKLDIPVDTQDELSDIVFRETNPVTFRLNGYGFDPYLQPKAPVKLEGSVRLKLNFTVSAP